MSRKKNSKQFFFISKPYRSSANKAKKKKKKSWTTIMSIRFGKKLNLIFFFSPICMDCERLQIWYFFFQGMFAEYSVILNIKDIFAVVTFRWNFGLLSRLMQNIGFFFHLGYLSLVSGVTDCLNFPCWFFFPQCFTVLFSSHINRYGRIQHSRTQISVSLNINESICANGDFYNQRRYLPVLYHLFMNSRVKYKYMVHFAHSMILYYKFSLLHLYTQWDTHYTSK